MPNDRLPKKLLFGEVNGLRPGGRGLVSMMLHGVIVKNVELVDLIEMRKTDWFGETRLLFLSSLQQSLLNTNSLSSVKMLWLTAHCFASEKLYYKRKLVCFHKQHCPLETCLVMAFACYTAAHLPSCWQTDFLGRRTVRVKALQLALRTLSAAVVPPTHAFDGELAVN